MLESSSLPILNTVWLIRTVRKHLKTILKRSLKHLKYVWKSKFKICRWEGSWTQICSDYYVRPLRHMRMRICLQPTVYANVFECWCISRIYGRTFKPKSVIIFRFLDNYQKAIAQMSVHTLRLLAYRFASFCLCTESVYCVMCMRMKSERLWALIKYEKWLLRQILAIGRLHVFVSV